MNIFGILMVMMIGGPILAAFIYAFWPSVTDSIRQPKRLLMPSTWLALLVGYLLIMGTIEFFGTAISGLGGFNWIPKTFEWPVAIGFDIVDIPNGYHVVPHKSAGRIQVYDADWNFHAGWSVPSAGKPLKTYIENRNIHVVSYLEKTHAVYDLDGSLISKKTEIDFDSYPENDGYISVVPTNILLWPAANPFIGWACSAGLFFIGTMFVKPQDKSDDAT